MEELSKSKDKEMSKDMEEISKEEKQQNYGPFLLEHFDSSEYSLAVPGEGSRPEVRIVWMDGEGFNQRPVSLTLQHLGSPYYGEVGISY